MTVEYLDLADSALHAPGAAFGDQEFFEDFVDKAAVLVVRASRRSAGECSGDARTAHR